MLERYLRRAVERGDLQVAEGAGPPRRYGDGTGRPVRIRLAPGAALRIALQPELKIGECYMDGELVFEEGGFLDLLELVAANPRFYRHPRTAARRLREAALARLSQANDRRAARRNVRHHYDLRHDFYRLFLDPDLQYSCAYFARPGLTLEEAQAAKKAHIAAKLRLPERGRLLDIGCGWGGLALSLARFAPGLEITGVTLSPEQLAVARARAEAAGLSDRVRFQLMDYRDVAGPFDRIVSVGMFEHVGRPHFAEFFTHAARLLGPDGVMLLHAIGRSTPPGVTQPFIAKHVFPGGHIPSLSEVWPAVEEAGLWATDLEVLRLHYAETLRAWTRRFEARRAEVEALYDERFARLWEVYLASSEAAFRWFGMMVWQLQLTRSQHALPLTRDYMGETERMLREASSPSPLTGEGAAMGVAAGR